MGWITQALLEQRVLGKPSTYKRDLPGLCCNLEAQMDGFLLAIGEKLDSRGLTLGFLTL